LKSCELCGREKERVYLAIFEGKRVYACSDCIRKFSLVKISTVAEVKQHVSLRRSIEKIKKPLYSALNTEDYELIEDYGFKIKSAREKLGLTQSELASKLKIKVSLLKKIEAGKITPTPDLIRKLEKSLNIRLTEKVEVLEEEDSLKREKHIFKLGDFIREGE